MRGLQRSLANDAVEAGATAAYSAVTIAARLPILAGCLVAPGGAAMAEWNRACAEKVAAGWEGAFAATAQWQALVWRSVLRPPTLAALAGDAADLARTAARPARRKVKANARRLTRAKRK